MGIIETIELKDKIREDLECLEPINVTDAESLEAAINERKIKHIIPMWTNINGDLHAQEFVTEHIDANSLKMGFTIDGSSFPNWQNIAESDLLLIPDFSTAFIDPLDPHSIRLFTTVCMPDGTSYSKCPRATMKKAEKALTLSGIGDEALFGPEPEFFMVDAISFTADPHDHGFRITDTAGRWNSGERTQGSNPANGAYMVTDEKDPAADIRKTIQLVLNKAGVKITKGHTEVGGLQHELGMGVSPGLEAADKLQLYKFYVRRVAELFGKQVTFIPKLLTGENGSGMHVHMSINKDGRNLFSQGTGLSATAEFAMAGLINNANDIAAITNPATVSYKRLIPGYEAPNALVVSKNNRSAGIRIPAFYSEKEARFEVRWGDPLANPYLLYAAHTLAMIDGIKKKDNQFKMVDYDLFENPARLKQDGIKFLVGSLDAALENLRKPTNFLAGTGVFATDLIDSYIAEKEGELDYLRQRVSPAEIELYLAR